MLVVVRLVNRRNHLRDNAKFCILCCVLTLMDAELASLSLVTLLCTLFDLLLPLTVLGLYAWQLLVSTYVFFLAMVRFVTSCQLQSLS